MQKIKNILLATIMMLSLTLVSGCNTVKGMGQDFESMGRSMQNAGD
ncbi:MAG: entericidin [Opitutales bacterium]